MRSLALPFTLLALAGCGPALSPYWGLDQVRTARLEVAWDGQRVALTAVDQCQTLRLETTLDGVLLRQLRSGGETNEGSGLPGLLICLDADFVGPMTSLTEGAVLQFEDGERTLSTRLPAGSCERGTCRFRINGELATWE